MKINMMNKMKSFLVALLLVVMLSVQSCNTDPSLASVSLVMKASTNNSTIVAGRLANTELEFTEVRVGVTEIELETLEENESEDSDDIDDDDDDGEDDNEEIEYEGRFTVDLIDGTSVPDFGIADLKPGLYEELEVEMEPIMEDGNTMFVAFNFTPEGSTESIRYEYSNTYEMEFEIEDDNGFQIDEAQINQLLIILDLDALFANVDLNTASVDADGVVRINSSSNQDLAQAIQQNLWSVLDGGEDEDGDGEYEDD